MNIIINNIPCTNIFALNDKYAKIKEKNYAQNQASFKGNLHVNQTISSKVFSNICQKNLIGEGKNSKVYNFLEPEFKDYVIKVIKPDAIEQNISLNELPKYNLGQAVMKIQDNIYILKKQSGVQHGFTNWCDIINGKVGINKNQALEFAQNIKKISEMPNSTFQELAKISKYLTENNYKIDSINPNNLLIDYEKNQINIIDYFKCNKYVNNHNSYLDMVGNILDFCLFKDILNTLPETYQKEFLTCSNNIIEKCYNAAIKTGLETDKQIFSEFIAKISYLFNSDFTQKYNTFKSLVKLI